MDSSHVLTARLAWVRLYEQDRHSAGRRGLRCGISRPTLRKWWRRYQSRGVEDLRIFARAEGAFTEPGTQQQVILFAMSVWPRCCPKTGLAIVEGDRLVRNVAFEGVAQGLAAGHDGSTAARVLALPGPTFTVERYARASCESTSWEPVGGPEPLAFVAPESSRYVDVLVP